MDNMLIGVHIQDKAGITHRIVDKVLVKSFNYSSPTIVHAYVLATGTAGNITITLVEPIDLNNYIIKGL